MKLGGFSTIGSYHEINQDSFIADKFLYGHYIVTSDGLGSKKLSQYGSKTLCDAVSTVLNRSDILCLLQNNNNLIFEFHKTWCERLKDYDIYECYATALITIIKEETILFFRLGDGFIAGVWDDFTQILFDKKENCYANETDCLNEYLQIENWEIVEKSKIGFKGAISCTDGIEILNSIEDDYKRFSNDFISSYLDQSLCDIIDHISNWLPQYGGNDDKTIAFIIN